MNTCRLNLWGFDVERAPRAGSSIVPSSCGSKVTTFAGRSSNSP